MNEKAQPQKTSLTVGNYLKGVFFATRIDRYLTTEILAPFLGGIVFFIFIFLMFQLLRLADFFIVHGVPAAILGKMTALMCLSFLPATLPPAFLFAVLIGFGRLSSDSELVALKANGLSLQRLAVPITVLATLVVVLSLVLNLEWVPWGERNLKKTIIKVGNTKFVSTIQEGTFTSGFFDLLVFADKVNRETNEMERVFIFDERDPKNPLTVVAKSGEILNVRTESELSAAALFKLKTGSIHKNDLETRIYQKIDYDEYRLFLKVDEGAVENISKPSHFSYRELKAKMAEAKKLNSDAWESREYEVEFWRRFSTAFTPLIFVFLGMGFGTFRTRAVRAGAILTAFITLAGYWSLQTWGVSLIQDRWATAFWGMQLPNIVALGFAIWSFRKSAW